MPVDLDPIMERVLRASARGDDRPQFDLERIVARVTQRWTEHRSTFLEPTDPFRPHRYAVEEVARHQAKAFVVGNHYLGTFATSIVPVGLWEARAPQPPKLVGVAVFGEPPREGIAKYTGGAYANPSGVELNRFVLLDEVPYHAETWFLARAFRVLADRRPQARVVLSYSDPVPRRALSGQIVMPGHIGTIYQAFNGVFVGRTRKDYLWLDAEGRTIGGRLLSKIRTEEKGEVYAAETLLAAGAPRRRHGESPRAWVERALTEGPFRRVKHAGKYTYLWPMGDRGQRRAALATFPDVTVPAERERLAALLAGSDAEIVAEAGRSIDPDDAVAVRRQRRKLKRRIEKMDQWLMQTERYPGDPQIKARARQQRHRRFGGSS